MKALYLASTAVAACLVSAPALAQQQGQSPSAQTGQDAGAQAGATSDPHSTTPSTAPAARDAAIPAADGDIVVTARRRDESLSKVPIAISVVTGEALARQSIRSESDLQSAVPGLTVKQTGSNNILSFSIRGQSIDAYTSSSPAVLPYVNEFQLVSYTSSSFFDLENVQILKGPQGTLFGRNTTGGAVLYQTALPGDQAKGFFSVRIGNLQEHQVTVGATMPIASWASLRVAGNFNDGGAYVRNLVNGEKFGDNLNKTGRATLLLKPAEGLRNVTTVQYGEDHGTNVPGLPGYVNPCGSVAPDGFAWFTAAACLYRPANPGFAAQVAANPGFFPGGLEAYPGYQRSIGNRAARVNASLRHDARTFFAINTTSFEVAPGLTLKNIAGVSKASKNDVYDFDGTSYPIYENAEDGHGQFESTRQFSDELQLQGQRGPVTFVVGAYYSNLTSIVNSRGIFFGYLPVTYDFRTHVESVAGFAQATYNLTRQLHLTGGFRYSQDKTTGQNLPDSVFGATRQDRKDSKPSWTVSLDYQVTPALLLYATHRGSWRSGGINFTGIPINANATQGGNLFDPETTKDVEIGAKFNGRLGDVPVTFAVAGFNQWVDNVQRAITGSIGGNPALFTTNVPKAEVTGVEASFTARPAPWLDLGASGSYTDARFTNGISTVLGAPVRFGPFGDVPKWSGSAYAQVTQQLARDAGAVSLRGDVYGQTSFYFSNLDASRTPGSLLPGYALVNARLSWERIMGTTITGSLYARNLFDKDYFAGGLATNLSFGLNSRNPGRPRTFGAELRVAF